MQTDSVFTQKIKRKSSGSVMFRG